MSYVIGVLAVLSEWHKQEYAPRRHTKDHRIPKVADSPFDTKLAFVPNTPTKKRRRAPMRKLINPNGEWLRS